MMLTSDRSKIILFLPVTVQSWLVARGVRNDLSVHYFFYIYI